MTDDLKDPKHKITFKVVPNLPYKERYELYNKLKDNNIFEKKYKGNNIFEKKYKGNNIFEKKYKGKMLTVQYVGLSHNGIPLQPKGKTIRDYE